MRLLLFFLIAVFQLCGMEKLPAPSQYPQEEWYKSACLKCIKIMKEKMGEDFITDEDLPECVLKEKQRHPSYVWEILIQDELFRTSLEQGEINRMDKERRAKLNKTEKNENHRE